MPLQVRLAASLTNRIFLACTLLVTLSLTSAFGYLYYRTSSDVESALTRDLDAARLLVRDHQSTQTRTHVITTELVADLPRLKAAVSTADAATVQPLAEEYRAQIESDAIVILDPEGRTLATVGRAIHPALPLDALETRPSRHSLRLDEHGLMEVVTVPIVLEDAPPALLGYLAVGFALDERRIRELQRLTRADVAFIAEGRVLASTLPETGSWNLARWPLHAAGTVTHGNEDYAVIAEPLAVEGNDVSAAQGPTFAVLYSRTERRQLLSAIRQGLLGALLAALVLAALLSYGVARTMTRPLRTVTSVMRAIADTGDLTRSVRLPSSNWKDEDARLLATTFNRLTESVSHFQRQEAQRERLSSLGRLSTVIAHEIRNPLMIIRTALHSLKRDESDEAGRAEAVADIEDEIRRLNRIVSDVLDFAKPVPLDRRPVDLNALCLASVEAAWADVRDPQVALDLDPHLPPVITDEERLRTALVNVLTNARQAVAADSRDGQAPASVTVSTRRAGDGVHVTVADQGSGIAPDLVDRVFEPYFTTRRTGTGLGLPIARNIVEGLGGTIRVESVIDAGTSLHITLPLGGTEGA